MLSTVAAALAGLLSGCSGVVESSPDRVAVETDVVGELMPGTRHWLGWLKANEHCAAHGKSPRLEDLKGSAAIYRCVSD